MEMFSRIRRLAPLIKYRHHLLKVAKVYAMYADDPENANWGTLAPGDETGVQEAIARSNALPGPIVELGTLFGQTTNMIAAMKAPERQLITVDNYCWNPFAMPASVHRAFTRRALRLAVDRANTVIYDGDASAFHAANKTLVPSMIFIDADHRYEGVKKDIAWAVSTGCPVISGHDYSPRFPDVMRAVDEAFGANITVYETVWIANTDRAPTGTS